MGFHHGLSGLNASSKSLDVIGHNIANSNTVGFKNSRAEFNEMVASAMGASSGSSAGIGVSVAAVAQQFSQGVITPTSNSLDMAINGNGFFCVQTASGQQAYTRSGNFQLSKTGDLVTVNGDKVLAYPLNASTNDIVGAPSIVNFPSDGIAAKASTKIEATLNLDARSAAQPDSNRVANGTSLQVYDSLGVAHSVSIYFEKTAGADNEWEVFDGIDDPNANPPYTANSLGTIKFDTSGKFESAQLSPISVTPSLGAGTPLDLELDLSKATQYGNAFSVSRLNQDGYSAGDLVGVNVSEDGTLMASYTNGITRGEARLALATFTNNQGLVPAGNNNWVASAESNQAVINPAGAGSSGVIQGNALEESNVDLTAELVNMMTAQRAYQANAQTIKTQDQVFSTLVNLR